MRTQSASKIPTLNIAAILESAGADINAPAGSQAHSLALVQDACRDLPGTPAAPAALLSLAPSARQWIKVGADGSHYPPGDTRTDHVAAIDVATGLMYCVTSLGESDDAPDESMTQQQCIKRCQDLRLLGFNDWALASRNEAAWIIDDTRRAPAVDRDIFPGIKPDWHWTSTALMNRDGTASASGAWLVDFSKGGVSDYRRDFDGFALAVRRSGQ